MAKKENEEKVTVEALTDIGLVGRDGYVKKGDECEVTVSELAKNPESYALLKEPSKKLSEKVAEIQEAEGVQEKSSLADQNYSGGPATTAVAPDYETNAQKYDEHLEEMKDKGKSKGGKK